MAAIGKSAPAKQNGRIASTDLAHDMRQAWLVAVSAGLGFLFDAYVVNIYSFVLPLIAVSFSLSTTAQGVIGSVMLAGYTLGTFAFGYAADRFGRKNTLGTSIALYGLTTAVSGAAGGAGLFAGLRFVTGLGGAGELAVGVPYTVEAWPAKRRAIGAGGVIFSLYAVGALIALAVALLVAPAAGWRLTFILALIPAGLVYVLRRAYASPPLSWPRARSGAPLARPAVRSARSCRPRVCAAVWGSRRSSSSPTRSATGASSSSSRSTCSAASASPSASRWR
jgi:MFS transporter, putative metabolite:H+ symporter